MVTRKYEQRMRAESSEETRRRILDTLHERLRVAPSEPVSVDRLAQMAGVARATVYVVFGSRAGLFCALGADLLDRGGFEELLRASAHPDAREALRGGLRRIAAMYATDPEVRRALYSMAQLDKEAVGGAVQKLEQGRAVGMGKLANRLAKQGLLRPKVGAGDAADLLFLLTSYDTFDLLYANRGRNVEQVAELLVTTAELTLVDR